MLAVCVHADTDDVIGGVAGVVNERDHASNGGLEAMDDAGNVMMYTQYYMFTCLVYIHLPLL
jgi:hypothetical protein